MEFSVDREYHVHGLGIACSNFEDASVGVCCNISNNGAWHVFRIDLLLTFIGIIYFVPEVLDVSAVVSNPLIVIIREGLSL